MPVELAEYIHRRAAERLRQYAGSELHIATVRSLVAARAAEDDPAAVRQLLEALVDDLIYLTSELWIVIDMLSSRD